MQGQLAWAGFAAGTARPDLTGRTALFGKQHLNGWFATRPLSWLPVLTLLPHRTRHAFVVPVYMKVADIVRLRIVRLPALILAHRPGEIDLIVVLTADELFSGGVGAVDQVDGRQQRLPGQRLMDRLDDSNVLRRRCGSFHVRDEMGRVVLTGLREMHLIAAPALPPLLTIARVHIIGRGDHHG